MPTLVAAAATEGMPLALLPSLRRFGYIFLFMFLLLLLYRLL